jgi:hypothetical protein
MKIALLVLLVVIAVVAFAAIRKTVAEAPVEEAEISVADVPAVFSRLKSKAEEGTFTVFVFSPGSGAFRADEAINLQFCFEDGRAGFDWVLLGQPNVRDRKKYEQLAAALGYKTLLREKNGVQYLRTTEGDLPRLCERAICDLYGKKKGSRIGLLTRGIRWP